MSLFCTRCGKPLLAGARFCPACGGAVASPVAQPPDLSATPATPFQQTTPFTPVTPPASREPIVSPASENNWTTVAAPAGPEIAQPAHPEQFTPVQVPEAHQPASDPSPARAGAAVAPIDVPAANGTADAATPGQGQHTPGQQGSFSPVSFSTAPSASTPNQGWSQPMLPPAANQQWSQPAPGSPPPPMPAAALWPAAAAPLRAAEVDWHRVGPYLARRRVSGGRRGLCGIQGAAKSASCERECLPPRP